MVGSAVRATVQVAVEATAKAMSALTVVDRPGFTTGTTAALRPAVALRTVGVPRTGGPVVGTSFTGVPAAVLRASVPMASTAASRPAAVTAVSRSVDGPCPVADGKTGEAIETKAAAWARYRKALSRLSLESGGEVALNGDSAAPSKRRTWWYFNL